MFLTKVWDLNKIMSKPGTYSTGRRIDPSWGEPIELFLVPASAP